MTALTLAAFKAAHLPRTLAQILRPERVDALLLRAGHERDEPLPNSGDPQAFWIELAHDADAGAFRTLTLNSLIYAAQDMFPQNMVFADTIRAIEGREEAEPEAESLPPPRDQQRGSTIYITTGGGAPSAAAVTARVLEVFPEAGQPQVIHESDGRVALNFPAIDIALGERIAAFLLDDPILEQAEPPRQTQAFDNADRDGVYERLTVVGPDQARYELTDVPHSTPVSEVGEALMATYREEFPGTERTGLPRQNTIDIVGDQGEYRRAQPESTLIQEGVRDGQTLHVGQEMTAGAVDPIIREDALARLLVQVRGYAADRRAEGGNFSIRANADAAPTLYELEFDAPSFGPPDKPGGAPKPISEHKARIQLLPDFPMKAPIILWQTPIFHPNIDPKTGLVCLGVLDKAYRPGLDFAELLQMLVDMASYRNYVLHEGYNTAAAQWAGSPEGMRAIDARGGRVLAREMFDQLEKLYGFQPRRTSRFAVERIDP